MASAAEVAAMRRAIALAAEQTGRTNPNPPVGCVLLDPAGTELAAAAHERAGGPHAEAAALTLAGARARGATAVVTLEPCRHTGRTGPCTRRLLDAGVARVVYAVTDPDPTAAGGGAELAAAGVDVEGGVLRDEAATVLTGWLVAATRGRPYVTVKFATTLDGRAAAADGTSRWITGDEARADAHRLRAESAAGVVGVGTVLADDPQLTARVVDVGRQPVRVVVDTRLRTPATAALLTADGTTLVATGRPAPAERCAALTAAGATVVELPTTADGVVDLIALLTDLYTRDLRLVLVEGGPTLAAAFLRAGLVDRVVAYVAPALLGAGPAAIGDLGITTVTAARRLPLSDVRRLGTDIRLTAGA